MHFKSALISTDSSRTLRLSTLYCISITKTSSHDTSYRFCLNFTNIEAAIGGKSSRERFWNKSSQCREIQLQVKKVITSFGCYGNSDAIVTLINANVHHYLIQLWRLFFQIFVNGDVFYAQTWEVLTRQKFHRATLT